MIERIAWFIWRVRFVMMLSRMGVYKMRLHAIEHAWAEATAARDYFEWGHTPREAFREDMSYGD